MPQHLKRFLFILSVMVCVQSRGSGLEVFGKGSLSKSFIQVDNSTQEVSISGGLALGLLTGVRLEGRYTNISSLQSKLEVQSGGLVGTLNNIKTETSIISVGLDIDFLGEKSAFQPFIYIGGGYIETTRSYYFTTANSGTANYYAEPNQTGFSANGGAGFRVRVARSVALELELFAYGINVQKPNPLINYIGTAGVRVFM